MLSMFILDRSHHDPLEPDLLLRGLLGEYAQRLARCGLPNGLFDNGAITSYLARLFSQPGRTDDYRKLAHKLFIVATDLDSVKAAPFGAYRALQACRRVQKLDAEDAREEAEG
jgi:hypothetical protein